MTATNTPQPTTDNATSNGDDATLSRRERAAESLHQRLDRPAPTVWLSGQEAAEYLGVSWPTLRQLLLDHDIPHIHIRTLWRIDVAVLDEHLHRIANGG